MSVRVEGQSPDVWAPGPATNAGPPPGDVATILLECMVNSRGAQREAALADAESMRALLERAREQIRRAMEQAEEAQESGGFWGDVSRVFGSDIASIAGVVAAAALAVGTCGAGTPAILAMVAAGCTLGAKVGQELGLDPRLAAALGGAGSLMGLFAGNMTGASTAWTTVSNVAGAAQGAATGVGGAATVVEGQYLSEAAHHQAEAAEARGRQEDAWLRLDLALDLLERACRDVARAKERTSDVVKTENDAEFAVLSNVGAA